MKKKNEEAKSKLDESEDNIRNIENEISKKEKQLKTFESKINSLKKQIETKSRNIEELQQDNKALRKKVATESKQSSIMEEKVNKLQLELESMKKLHKETTDNYKNEIEKARAVEEKLFKEAESMKSVADEAVAKQKEIDIQCQHKITEMVALMEKHKHQYDKTVEEKDAVLECYKTKEQEVSSTIGSLKSELSNKKKELSSLQEQLKIEMEEKEKLARETNKGDISKKEKRHQKTQTSFLETHKTSSLDSPSLHSKKKMSQNFTPANVNKEKSSWTPARTYTVKTPPKSKLLRESTSLLSEEVTKKKRKVLLELDTQSDTSENNDLLSIVSEEEMFKKLYKDYPQTSRLCVLTPKKVHMPPTLKTPGSVVKVAALRKMRDAGWTAISKVDRKEKMKEAEKLFA
ncbi:synaptonemal complex protein 1-like [Lacerta agilis]|uniref:synaptonemal complex protein 1-like n=1 Tax=Lacerta agilis TaxID=80427 RepID=UPI0014196F9F|nr:synaptonemal complex protein 1-like [Lacerta agilis]